MNVQYLSMYVTQKIHVIQRAHVPGRWPLAACSPCHQSSCALGDFCIKHIQNSRLIFWVHYFVG